MSFRLWLAEKIAGTRAQPLTFAPEIQGAFLGNGIGSNQPDKAVLLKENIGVSDIATRAIANRLASLEFEVKVSRRSSKGTLEDEVLDDHVLKVLLDKPHVNFTRAQMLRLLGQYIPACGEGYWLKIRNGFGIPTALQPMPPQHVEPIVKRGMIDSYSIEDGRGNVHTIPGSEVIRFWFPDPETLYTAEGYLGPNGINTDAARFATEHLRKQYQNDAIPSVVLKPGDNAAAPTDTTWDRFQRDWMRKYHARTGSARGLPAALPSNWDLIQIAISSGADVTPLLEFWQSNQLMNFGVPASVLGRVISGDRSSAETNQWVFDRFAVKPIADLIADTLTQYLAVEYDPNISVDFEKFVSDDKQFILQQESQDLALKVRSPQQILRDRGGDPEDAWWGEAPVGTFSDQPYMGEMSEDMLPADDPSALMEPDDEDEADEPEEGEASAPRMRDREALLDAAWQRVLQRERKWRPKFERAARGVFESQRKDVIAKLKATDRQRATVDFDALIDDELWAKLWEARLQPLRMDAFLEAAGQAFLLMDIGAEFIFTEAVAAVIREQGAALVKNTTAVTRKRIQKALLEGNAGGESLKDIEKRINTIFAGRRKNARTIARTEVQKSTQMAHREAAMQAEEMYGLTVWQVWNDARDPAVRDSHQASLIKPVRAGQAFTLANGVQARAPGDADTPEDSINCRCFITETFDDPEGIQK